MKKKVKSLFLVSFVSLTLLSACGGGKQEDVSSASSTSIPAPEIADLTLDLLNPDNQVVPYGIYTNASLTIEGTKLTDQQFLLGSKISKSYLKELGPREKAYDCVFSSDQGQDGFALTITDSSDLSLWVDSTLDGKVFEKGSVSIGDFVLQSEDSYQPVTLKFTLQKEGVEIPFSEDLEEGKYTYTCAVYRSGTFAKNITATFSVLSASDYFDYCLEPVNLLSFITVSDGDSQAISLKNDEFLIQSDGERTFTIPASLIEKGKLLGKNLIGMSVRVDQDVTAPSTTNSVFSATYADSLKAYPGNVLAATPYIVSTPLAMMSTTDPSYSFSFKVAGTYRIADFGIWDSDWLNLDVTGDRGGISLNKDSAGKVIYTFFDNSDTDWKQFGLKRSLVDQALVAGKSNFYANLTPSASISASDYHTIWLTDGWSSSSPSVWRNMTLTAGTEYKAGPISLTNLSQTAYLKNTVCLQFGTIMTVTMSSYYFA
jgi:hypothetical protein